MYVALCTTWTLEVRKIIKTNKRSLTGHRFTYRWSPGVGSVLQGQVRTGLASLQTLAFPAGWLGNLDVDLPAAVCFPLRHQPPSILWVDRLRKLSSKESRRYYLRLCGMVDSRLLQTSSACRCLKACVKTQVTHTPSHRAVPSLT